MPTMVLVLAAMMGATHTAAAADATCSKASDPLYAKGKLHFDEGLRLMRKAGAKSDLPLLEQAYAEFQAAHKICQTQNVIYYMAKAEVGLKKPVEAMRHLREWVRRNGGMPKPAAPGDKKAAELNDDFNDIWPVAYGATAHVQIDAANDAQVLVDGAPLETRAPFTEPIDVLPGTREFEARLGNQSRKAHAALTGGQETRLNLAFDAPVAVAAVPAAVAGAQESAPRLESPKADEPTETSGAFAWPPPTVSWILGGAALVSAAVGVGFSIDEASSAREADRLRAAGGSSVCADRSSPGCQAIQSELDANSRDKTVAAVLYGTAGLCAAGAVVFWALAPRESPSKSRAWLSPAFSPTGAGIRAGGQF